MRQFKGPRFQGGWVGIAAAVVGTAIKAYSDNKAKQKDKQNAEELSAQGFARQAWLAQQERKYQLEDRQRAEQDIANFRQFAPDSAKSFNGQPVFTPQQTSTQGLADWDPNKDQPSFGNLSLMPYRSQSNPG